MAVNPIVSIVLPTYNGSRYLQQSVQSVIDQNYSNWELIIVDDASTDDTPQIITELVPRDERIRVIRNDTNKKLPGALNVGFKYATGDFLTWTSDDNLYYPDAIKEMVNFLIGHPDIYFVYTDYNVISENNEITEIISVDPPELLGLQDPVGGCFLYRRIVYEVLGGYDEDFFLAEDTEFFIRILIKYKMDTLHKVLYSYRNHPGSLTQSKSRQIYKIHEKAVRKHLPEMRWVDKNMHSAIYARLAMKALAHRDLKEFIDYIFIAITASPGFVVKKSISKFLLRTEKK